MTPQELIDLPHHYDANNKLIEQGNWDHGYPTWFLDQIEAITNVILNERQRNELIDVYHEILEGYY